MQTLEQILSCIVLASVNKATYARPAPSIRLNPTRHIRTTLNSHRNPSTPHLHKTLGNHVCFSYTAYSYALDHKDHNCIIAIDMASLYSALPSSNSIRLLCLQPGVFEEQISSSLVVVNEFPPSDEYFAISYCWGDANDTTTLSCNNTLVPVTKSLYAALHRLRDKTHPLLIWADAICINQRDISERNQQILMMRQIYSGASCVYIWTGPGDISSTRALDLIESISHNCFKAIYGQDSSPSSWLGKLRKEQDRTQVVMNTRLTDLLPLRGISPSAWHMIWQFFQREWFFRVWVIQEVQACPNTWLLCGEKTIEWDHVVLAANWTLYAPYRDNTINWKVHHFPTYGGFHNAFFMWDQSLRTRREAPFPALLDLVRPFRASDPRDKVFAMLQSPLEQVGKSSRLENTDDRVALSTLENVSLL